MRSCCTSPQLHHMLQSTICTYPAPLSTQLQPLNLAAVCLQTCVWSVASAVAGDVFSVSAPLASGLPERGNCSLLAKFWVHKPPSFCAPANYAQAMRPTPAQPGKAMPRVVTMRHLFHTIHPTVDDLANAYTNKSRHMRRTRYCTSELQIAP
jgi:hypothetical protein